MQDFVNTADQLPVLYLIGFFSAAVLTTFSVDLLKNSACSSPWQSVKVKLASLVSTKLSKSMSQTYQSPAIRKPSAEAPRKELANAKNKPADVQSTPQATNDRVCNLEAQVQDLLAQKTRADAAFADSGTHNKERIEALEQQLELANVKNNLTAIQPDPPQTESNRVRQFEAQVQQLLAQKAEADTALASSETHNKEHVEALVQELEETRGLNKVLEDFAQTLQLQKVEDDKQVNTLKTEKRRVDEQLGRKTRETERAVGIIRNKDAQISKLEEEIHVHETLADNNENVCERLRKRCKEQEAALKKERSEKTELQQGQEAHIREAVQPKVEEILGKDREIARLNGEVRQKDESIASKDTQLAKQEGDLEQKDDSIADKDQELAKLQDEVEQSTKTIANKEEELAESQGDKKRLAQTTAEKEGEIATLRGNAEQFKSTVQEKVRELGELQRHLKRSTRTITEKDGEIATLQGVAKQLNNTITEKDCDITKLREDSKQSANTIAEKDSQLAKGEQLQAQQADEIAQLQQLLKEKEETISSQDAKLAEDQVWFSIINDGLANKAPDAGNTSPDDGAKNGSDAFDFNALPDAAGFNFDMGPPVTVNGSFGDAPFNFDMGPPVTVNGSFGDDPFNFDMGPPATVNGSFGDDPFNFDMGPPPAGSNLEPQGQANVNFGDDPFNFDMGPPTGFNSEPQGHFPVDTNFGNNPFNFNTAPDAAGPSTEAQGPFPVDTNFGDNPFNFNTAPDGAGPSSGPQGPFPVDTNFGDNPFNFNTAPDGAGPSSGPQGRFPADTNFGGIPFNFNAAPDAAGPSSEPKGH